MSNDGREEPGMGVQHQLGIDEGSALIVEVRECWPGWRAAEPRLSPVEGFDDLRSWLRRSDPAESDALLLGLARLAAVDGGNDVAAAGALAYTLVPGAARLASRLLTSLSGVEHCTPTSASMPSPLACPVFPTAASSVSSSWLSSTASSVLVTDTEGGSPSSETEHPDVLVAAQLWVEVRAFPWQRRRLVAANILANTRSAVLADYGSFAHVARRDPTWARTTPLEAFAGGDLDDDTVTSTQGLSAEASLWRRTVRALESDAGSGDAVDELGDVLAWAVQSHVLSCSDRLLLEGLMREARVLYERGALRARDLRQGNRLGNRAGLTSRQVTSQVARAMGLSEISTRRRISAVLRDLAAASRSYPDPASDRVTPARVAARNVA
ncbi:MAG: hypothetical protein WA966_10880 [Ornithinimicrobium sp.]